MTGPFKWASATQVGPSHISGGLPCQDAVSVTTTTGSDGIPWIIAALADGAGSADKSEQGATYATQCFTALLKDAFRETGAVQEEDLNDLLQRGIAHVHKTLGAVANNNSTPAFDYAATFLGCVVSPTLCGLVQIGDGAIIHGDLNHWTLAFTPQRGQFANETYFITDDKAFDRIEIKVLKETPSVIAMVSDGLEDLLVQTGTQAVQPKLFNYFTQAFAAIGIEGESALLCKQLETFLVSPDVTARSDDDTSIITLNIAVGLS